MKALLIILGILLLLLAIYQPVLLIFAIVIFYFVYKNKGKNKKAKTTIESKNAVQSQKNIVHSQPVKTTEQKHFFFNVAGISKTNDKGQDIQRLIREYVKRELEFHEDAYDGMTNKEIFESGEEKVYEVNLSGSYEIIFEPEPENPYDPKAIKVIHGDIGHVGYVPQDFTDQMHYVLKNKDYEIEWKLIGGKYKYVDYDEDKVKTKTLNYGIVIDVYYTP